MKQKNPQHVAIIMDGNGRWAQERGLPRTSGHKAGVEVIKPILRSCAERKIKYLSVWAFSQDNWARPVTEVEYLLKLFFNSLEKELEELHSNGIRLRFLGDRTKLSEVLQRAMLSAEDLTRENAVTTLSVVINYTGRWDLTQAATNLAKDVAIGKLNADTIDEELFANYLVTSDIPDPDLFIRTSGEQRISNFFLWQLAYTELYFSDLAWPDFTTDEFIKALESFGCRERRFGKTSAQLLGEENV